MIVVRLLIASLLLFLPLTAQVLNGLTYQGGPVMLGTPVNYVIWYGLHWEDNSAPPIITHFLQTLGGSDWYFINTTYTQSDGSRVSGQLSYGGSVADKGSYGNYIQWYQLKDIVVDNIRKHNLPLDENYIYHIYTDWEVKVDGFKILFCGFHDSVLVDGKLIKYIFVGDAANNISCQPIGPGPNGYSSADGMINVIAHEIAETVTNPCGNNAFCVSAWAEPFTDIENADRCLWQFGEVQRGPTGGFSNMVIDGVKYLIQKNWVNSGGGMCVSGWVNENTPIVDGWTRWYMDQLKKKDHLQ